MPPLSEDNLIARYFAPLAGPGGLALKDDAALLRPAPGRDLVLTKDALVAGVHFFPDDPPDAIARKALRANLSDLAAKGARPEGFLLALALPAGWREAWLAEFARGLGEDAAAFGCALLGGDTVKTPGPLLVSITALGSVAAGRMVLRTGARAGDLLFVSGTIGDAALGLALRKGAAAGLSATDRAHLLDRYLLPRPRLALAGALADYSTGAMDVSDGLIGDLSKMMRTSGCGGDVALDMAPLSPAARAAIAREPALRDVALTGGDDYEILASVAPERAAAFRAAAQAAGVAVCEIGRAVEGAGFVAWREAGGRLRRFERESFSHF